ncbi:aspartate/glutamate racemase family protein [Actinacidiphila sp. ITFR-21]|uniref:aspartate/glutamate racemase family protein n=1 Tax=Actinacidiphila sp. ITFR-21 TaxID=3075199 RepID=UPI00288A3B66|nr:aspartate/glutamate racemase family protein [Streptomyces sp. ITFR-21]WNI14298.1 aspartate/glutamate racemase family protein [Streptomyces sp. ITFR-21]
MRIWFHKHTVEGRLPLLDQWYREHLDAVADPGTTVDIKTLPAETYPDSTPFSLVGHHSAQVLFSQHFAQAAVTAERQGYDAWVIAAGQDPGLRDARPLAAIPTVGYGESAFFLSAMTGQRFAVLGFMPPLEEPIRANIRRYGLESSLSGYEVIPGSWDSVHRSLEGDFDQFVEMYSAAAERAAKSGAEVIIPAEGIPNEILWHLGIHELHGLPVVDPAGLAVKLAETLVHLGELRLFSRSSHGYWFSRPEQAVTTHLEKVFLGSGL